MSGTKARLRKIAAHPLLPFVLLWAFLTVCHLLFTLGTGDDAHYATVIPNQGLLNHLKWAYANWSARTLVDGGTVILNYLPRILWRLANPIIILVCGISISAMVGKLKDAATNWFLCGLLLLYPWQVMASAGWVSTTSVYLWPMAFGLLALVPTAAIARGKTPGKLWWLALPGLLYAANNEQLLIVLLPLLLVLCGWLWFTRKKVYPLILAQLGVVLADLVWLLSCPGTRMRFESESSSWYPAFAMKSLFSKVELGASVTLADAYFARNFIQFFFCLLLAFVVWRRYKNWLYRIVALYPLAVCAVFGLYADRLATLVPGIARFTTALGGEGMITLSNVNALTSYIPLLVLYTAFAATVVCIYLALGHTPKSFSAICIWGAGAASRVAMGFTPTVWTSGPRTGIFFAFTTMAVALLVFNEARTCAKRLHKIVFLFLFITYCLLGAYSIQEMRIATGYG